MNILFASVFSLAAVAAFSLPIHARLGETEGQSQVRYGQPREDLLGPQDKPLLAGALEKQYLYEGFRVRAAFVEGKCLVMEYAHIPDNGGLKQFSDAEVKAILAAESGLDEKKLAGMPKDKQMEMQSRRWKEEKVKDKGAVGDIARGIQGALKLNKWERTDGAIAEFALGLVLKISDRTADDAARRLARDAKKQPAQPGQPGAKPVVPKF